MPAPAIAVTADQIDAEWMTQALRASGALPNGRVAAIDARTGHRGPYSAARALAQRAPAVIERATPVPAWQDSSGQPLRSGFGGQVQPGY